MLMIATMSMTVKMTMMMERMSIGDGNGDDGVLMKGVVRMTMLVTIMSMIVVTILMMMLVANHW